MKNEGTQTNKLNEWLKTVDVDAMPFCEVQLIDAFRFKRHFSLSGNADDAIKKFAELAEMEILEVVLECEDDLRGESVIVAYDLDEGRMLCHGYERWWEKEISQHPEKKYLLLFNVDKADTRTLDFLKIEMEKLDSRSYRPVVGIVCHDAARDMQSKADNFVGPYRITWDK